MTTKSVPEEVFYRIRSQKNAHRICFVYETIYSTSCSTTVKSRSFLILHCVRRSIIFQCALNFLCLFPIGLQFFRNETEKIWSHDRKIA